MVILSESIHYDWDKIPPPSFDNLLIKPMMMFFQIPFEIGTG